MAEMSRPAGEGATVDQIRADIDKGRAGDKVKGIDPAAAPLGADEEAGGSRPSPQLLAAERERQRKPDVPVAAPAPEDTPSGNPKLSGAVPAGLAIGVIGAAVVGLGLWLTVTL